MLEHGGNLREVASRYAIPMNRWLDLSTGINPHGWPVPEVPARIWQRLPEQGDGLEQAAAEYYGSEQLLPVAGSQAAISRLPLLREPCRVGLLGLSYNEHAHAWRQAGHEVVSLSVDQVEEALPQLDVLLLVNPNNPTGQLWTPMQLLGFADQLAEKGGCLIVDEAFIDAWPEQSLLPFIGRPGLIVLRSLGKFFGLAGIRLGFVFAQQDVLDSLGERANPWEVNHVARHVGRLALMDVAWQRQMRRDLPRKARRLESMLKEAGLPPQGGCGLFQWLAVDDAELVQQRLAEQAVWVRRFTQIPSLRFGLPASEADWQQLERALKSLNRL
jgi:cobalamin biosynthetic protein CobC